MLFVVWLIKRKDIKIYKFWNKIFKKIDYSINCCYPRNKSWNDDFEIERDFIK